MQSSSQVPIELLIQQPWTVSVSRDEENGYVARVQELPDAIATADDPKDLERELWAAIRASIAARREFNEPIPMVEGYQLPVLVNPEIVVMRQEILTASMTPVTVLAS